MSYNASNGHENGHPLTDVHVCVDRIKRDTKVVRNLKRAGAIETNELEFHKTQTLCELSTVNILYL